MVEVTVEITQYCPHSCRFCSSNAGPKGKHLDKEKIFSFLRNQHNIERINISGGEPVAHPDFYEILMFCYKRTPNVIVYTNAFTNIRFNAHIVNEVNIEANVCIIPGQDNYIPKKAHKVHLLKLVPKGRAYNLKEANVPITVSSNFGRKGCNECFHILLQADGKIVSTPCTKEYDKCGNNV